MTETTNGTPTQSFAAGGYRYVPGVFQYSGGVAAEAGFEIRRVRFHKPLPVAEGFAAIEAHLGDAGRPPTVFCACELRSPGQFSEEGFKAFNTQYVETLSNWGIFKGGINPVARSNVCPVVAPPSAPVFYAFSYTVEADNAPPTFVVAGSGEAPEGHANYRDHIVRLDDLSPEGLREKAAFVLGEMERRQAALGFGWADVTETQVYTVHDIYPFIRDDIVARGATNGGLTWHFVRPPVVGLEFEMDCRGVRHESII